MSRSKYSSDKKYIAVHNGSEFECAGAQMDMLLKCGKQKFKNANMYGIYALQSGNRVIFMNTAYPTLNSLRIAENAFRGKGYVVYSFANVKLVKRG